MTEYDARSCLLHVHALYPKASDHWSPVRQLAFRDQITPLPITVEQFRAVASAVAMANKPSWCPPESAILSKLRGVAESVNTSRRVVATRDVAHQHGPDDKTAQEWTAEYMARPEWQEELNPQQLRGLSMLAESRERRLA